MAEVIVPDSAEEAAAALGDADQAGRRVRLVGGGTKLGWGTPPSAVDLEVSTARLDRILEHNAADLTAVVEAGVPLSRAQKAFAEAGQMLAIDPPDPGARATIGGVVAAGDSGPLRHRYGGPRDLLLGMRVALPDGALARSGGKVIKNVAGYDLAKLYAGSFGTLGLIVELVVRLHPLPARRATAVGRSGDPGALQRAAIAVGRASLELESFDVRWEEGRGMLLARVGGVAPVERAERASALMGEAGLEAEVDEDEAGLWDQQRAMQRSADGAIVRVSSVRTELARVLRAAAELGAEVTGRAGHGLFWIRLPAADDDGLVAAVDEIRAALASRPCVVQDAPERVRGKVDVWGEASSVELMRSVKARFDPNGTCNPGIYVGGI